MDDLEKKTAERTKMNEHIKRYQQNTLDVLGRRRTDWSCSQSRWMAEHRQHWQTQLPWNISAVLDFARGHKSRYAFLMELLTEYAKSCNEDK